MTTNIINDPKTFQWESLDKWNIRINEALKGLDVYASNDCSSYFLYIALRAALLPVFPDQFLLLFLIFMYDSGPEVSV